MRSFIVLGLFCLAAVVTAQEFANCQSSLVTGVPDDQITASSFWCFNNSYCDLENATDGSSAKYGRLSSTGWLTGGWTAKTQDTNQFIQVDFGTPKWITAVVLKARDYSDKNVTQWVKAFKVKTSFDCNSWDTIKDTDGSDKTFAGNTGINEEVTSNMPIIKKAQCVQINPTKWEYYISLRFDILGA